MTTHLTKTRLTIAVVITTLALGIYYSTRRDIYTDPRPEDSYELVSDLLISDDFGTPGPLVKMASLFGKGSTVKQWQTEKVAEKREAATAALIRIGKPAIPSLIDLFENEGSIWQEENQRSVLAVINEIGTEADQAVPILIESLGNKSIARASSQTLVSIGEPAILPLAEFIKDFQSQQVNDSDSYEDPIDNDSRFIRYSNACSTLKKIDPSAAKKAGVE